MQYEVCLSHKVSARTVREAKELVIQFVKVRELKPMALSPADVASQLKKERTSNKEHFVVFHLNTQNDIVKKELVSLGTLNASLIHPREVFRSAIITNCASVIVAHNHPSGSLEPSDEDISVTKRLREAGQLLGIEVLDHVIVTATGHKSLKEHNFI